MSKDDILNFDVLFYSPDGEGSPVYDALLSIDKKDHKAYLKCLDEMKALPFSVRYKLIKKVQAYNHGKHRFFELRVAFNKNIYRFFFVMEEPNMIVFFGFMKKTQKTEKKDVTKGVQYLEEYLKSKTTLKPFDKV